MLVESLLLELLLLSDEVEEEVDALRLRFAVAVAAATGFAAGLDLATTARGGADDAELLLSSLLDVSESSDDDEDGGAGADFAFVDGAVLAAVGVTRGRAAPLRATAPRAPDDELSLLLLLLLLLLSLLLDVYE